MSLYTRFELRQRARPHIEWLCRETEETCQLQIPRGDMMLVLDTVSPEVSYYLRVVPGGLVYYHPNAYGKVVLAFLSEEEVKKIIPPRLPSLTPHTIVLRTELMKQLEEVRKTGLGYDNEEYNEGIRCIGAPVFDVEGKAVAGLGVSGLVSTFREQPAGDLRAARPGVCLPGVKGHRVLRRLLRRQALPSPVANSLQASGDIAAAAVSAARSDRRRADAPASRPDRVPPELLQRSKQGHVILGFYRGMDRIAG